MDRSGRFRFSFPLAHLGALLAVVTLGWPQTVHAQIPIVSSALAEGTHEGADAEGVTVPFSLSDLPNHPARLFQPYLSGPILTGADSERLERIQAFRELLNLYAERQGVDDNFTIRLVDERNGEVLELYELTAERKRFEETGEVDWDDIDRKRARVQRRLVDRHARRVPRQFITVKWGRANQVREARQREAPHIEYELALAKYLDLSLLATEIGTVETFNLDDLVSSAGARSRYQFMPYLLRRHGIRQYSLRTAAGNRISVIEEHHPLLMMEPAFLTMRGYVNAVGHEVPGLSAYHTGPGNIFKIYRDYLARERDELTPGVTVLDAFVWGLTDGFDVVRQGSSFGNYSRGYIPSLYGSLHAVQDLPVDTSRTMLAELVRLKPGRSMYLAELLQTLSPVRMSLALRDPNRSMYSIFREMNPHMNLPESDGAVPPRGNVHLTSRSGGDPVRFFLPLGAMSALEAAGVNILDADEMRRFSHDTYLDPEAEKTEWDYDYEDLVRNVGQFGFTYENRKRLDHLTEQFERLAQADPSPFRRAQLTVIREHHRLWHSEPWEKLADAVASADLSIAYERTPRTQRDPAPTRTETVNALATDRRSADQTAPDRRRGTSHSGRSRLQREPPQPSETTPQPSVPAPRPTPPEGGKVSGW